MELEDTHQKVKIMANRNFNSFARGMQVGSNLVGQLYPVVGALKEYKNDQIANSLMNERAAIPRAQVVGDNAELIQAMADKKAARMPGFYTGGADELKMRMALERQDADMSNQQLDNAMNARRLNLMEQNLQSDNDYRQQALQAQKDEREQKRAQQAFEQQTQKQQEAFRNSLSYNTNMRANLGLLQKAENEDQYNQVVDTIGALYNSAIASGLKVPEPQIPPYMSMTDRTDLDQAQQAVDAAQEKVNERGADAKDGPNWWPFTATKGQQLQQAQQALEQLRQKAGASTPAYQPATPQVAAPQAQPSPTPAPTSPNSSLRDGMTATNPNTGEKVIRKNGKWVPVQ